RPNPISTRLSVAAMLWRSARSYNRVGKLRITSAGLGRITGEMSRLSALAPSVANHHTKTTTPTAAAPTSWRVTLGGGTRSAKRFDKLFRGRRCLRRVHLD